MNGLKYEFKDIKDVDISKLDVSKMYYTIDKNGDNRLSSTYWLLDGDFTYILMPCSPIVETDKGGIFNNTEQYIQSLKKFLTKPTHLSVSKEVEETQDEYQKGFSDCLKWMRDKQGIAPKEVEEKCIEMLEWKFKNILSRYLITDLPTLALRKSNENYWHCKESKWILDEKELFKQFLKEGETNQ